MAGGIKIDLVTDTSQIKRGFKDTEEALAEVSDALDDVTKNGEEAGERLEKSFKDVAKSTKREARDMGKEISQSYDVAAEDSGEAMTQMKEDGFSNAKEVAASFDGSAESIVDGFQGAAAEMFSGFGPAGAAAGLAVAAGIGLGTAALEKQKEEAAEAEQAIWELAQGAIDAGTYQVTELQKIELLNAWLGDEDKKAKAQEFVDKFGGSISDYMAGQLGLGEKRAEIEQRVLDYYDEQRDRVMRTYDDTIERKTVLEDIDTLQKTSLEDLYSQDQAIRDANKSAAEVRQTMLDIGAGINEWSEPTDAIIEKMHGLAQLDATPQFYLTDPLREARSIYDILLKASKIKLPTTRSVR